MLARNANGPQGRSAVAKFDRVSDLSYIFLARQQWCGSIRQLPPEVISPRASELPPQCGRTQQNQRLAGRRDPLMAVSGGSLNVVRERPAKIVSNRPIGRRLLKPEEAAQYLGLEVDTVYKKSRLRELPSVKVGGALRFDVIALERYIEEHTIKTID